MKRFVKLICLTLVTTFMCGLFVGCGSKEYDIDGHEIAKPDYNLVDAEGNMDWDAWQELWEKAEENPEKYNGKIVRISGRYYDGTFTQIGKSHNRFLFDKDTIHSSDDYSVLHNNSRAIKFSSNDSRFNGYSSNYLEGGVMYGKMNLVMQGEISTESFCPSINKAILIKIIEE